MKILLLFPPTWSLNVGSPHLAIPLLMAYLEVNGMEVKARDLNWEIAEYYNIRISIEEVKEACASSRLESLNYPYFLAEDKLIAIAEKYSCNWNLQLGFKFNRYSFSCSKDVREAIQTSSPFSPYYYDKLFPWIDDENPEIIGFSIASVYQLIPAFQISWLLRQRGYDGIIIMGGNTISRLGNNLKIPPLFDLIDAFILFGGEIPLLELCKAAKENISFEEIPNIIWENKDGYGIQTGSILDNQGVDKFPTPNFDDFPLNRYWGINY